jgi:hypothetical protein
MIARNHALTVQQYRALLKEADGSCAICQQKTDLHLDHCHYSGKLRGLLCVRCNTALGNFDDSPAILQSALAYVLKYREIHASAPQTKQDIERERRMAKMRR